MPWPQLSPTEIGPISGVGLHTHGLASDIGGEGGDTGRGGRTEIGPIPGGALRMEATRGLASDSGGGGGDAGSGGKTEIVPIPGGALRMEAMGSLASDTGGGGGDIGRGGRPRVLCLHGFRSSSDLLRVQLGKITSKMEDSFDFIFAQVRRAIYIDMYRFIDRHK